MTIFAGFVYSGRLLALEFGSLIVKVPRYIKFRACHVETYGLDA